VIVKTKFLCKSTTSISSGRSSKLFDTDLVTFEKGKWYDGEYETWSSEDGFRLNGGWRRYWAVNEQCKKEEIHKAWFKIMFEYDIEKIRDEKINNILNNE
jgi:hypothetical protein